MGCRGLRPGSTTVHALPQELMKSLQCQQLELECITSLGEEILSTCHPDSVITIKSWVTVAKSRFQEVSWAPLLHPSLGGEQICTRAWDKHGPMPFPPPVPLWCSSPDRRVVGSSGCLALSLANTEGLGLASDQPALAQFLLRRPGPP